MEEEESVLCRHYSTIGIGDVFISAPSHPLPQKYLLHSSGERSTGNCPKSSFMSWEIVGTIKASPEDFIVREIAPKARKILGVNNEKFEEDRVADLNFLSERDIAEQKATETCASTNAVAAKKPIPELAEKASPPVSLADLLQKMTRSRPPEVILGELNRLSQTAVESFEKTENAHRTENDLSSCVLVPLDAINGGKTSDQLSLERAEFHRAFRLAFPLLQFETISEERVSESGSLSKEFRVHVKIDMRFFDMVPYLYFPQIDIPDLYLFYKRGYEAARKSVDEHKQEANGPSRLNNGGRAVLRLRPDLPRSERRTVHEVLDRGSNRLLGSSTIPDYQFFDSSLQKEQMMTAAIIVKWSKLAERRMSRKRKRDDQRSGNSGSSRGQTFLFVLKKRGKEHLAAIKTLVLGLKCAESDIGLAGIKDMCAITYQFCTVSNVTSEQILRSKKFLLDRGMDVSTPALVDWRLEKGNLEGNRFQITLRNMMRVIIKQGEEESVPLELSHLQDMIDRVRLHGFVNFYGEQRVGIPGTEAIAGVRSFDIGRSMLQQDFTKAIDLLMTGRRHVHGNTTEKPAIQRFREVWKSSGGDPSKSWKALPRGAILLRERAVLRGLKRYGQDKPLEAFRCLHRNERTFFISAYQSYVWNKMVTERLERLGTRVVEGDLVQDEDGRVKRVTEDLSNWSIYNVVLPLPGYGVIFPANVIGELYTHILEQDGIRLTKDSPEEATSRGRYRRVVTMPSNIEFEPIQLDVGGKHVSSATISFDLPKGSYATMLLRELMLTTIDRVADYKGAEEDTT